MNAQPESPVLSVAMIVRNGGDSLRQTLESIRSIADEIVVLDTGSSDDSVELAMQYTNKVFTHPWKDDFSEARNACWTHVTGRWVLWLDAGERLDREDARTLKAEIEQLVDFRRAYFFAIQVARLGGEVSGEQIAKVRLVPNSPAIRFHGRIGEELLASLERQNITMDAFSIPIYRGAHHHDPAVKARRARRNILLAEIEVKTNGPTAKNLNLIARAFHDLGNDKQAQEFFEKALVLAEPGSIELLETYYGLLSALDSMPDSRHEQIAFCLKGVEQYPLDTQLLCALGGYLHGEGQLDLALRTYETAVNHGTVNPMTWHLQEIGEIAINCYATALQLSGRTEEAIEQIERGLSRYAASPRLQRHRIDLEILRGNVDAATEILEQVLDGSLSPDAIRSLAHGALAANRQDWARAVELLDSVYQAGCRDVLAMRWLAISLLSKGDISRAMQVVIQWLELDPLSVDAQMLRQRIEAHGASEPVDAERTADAAVQQIRYDTGAENGSRSACPPSYERLQSDRQG